MAYKKSRERRQREEHFTDYRANLQQDPFHALVPRTKSSNNSGITALPKWNFIRESPRSRAFQGESGSPACTAASSSHRLEPVASSLFQFSLRFEKSSGRCATREFTGRISSWDDIIPYLSVLSCPPSLFLDSLFLASGKPLVKDFRSTVFRLRSRNFISFRRLSHS